jgi:hypothetical protein
MIHDKAQIDRFKAITKRINKAIVFLDGPASMVEKEHYVPAFQELIQERSKITKQLELIDEDILRIEAEL